MESLNVDMNLGKEHRSIIITTVDLGALKFNGLLSYISKAAPYILILKVGPLHCTF